MDARVLIASIVVVVVLAMLAGGYAVNVFEQVKYTHSAHLDKEYGDIFKLILAGAITCLTILGRATNRKKKDEKEKSE